MGIPEECDGHGVSDLIQWNVDLLKPICPDSSLHPSVSSGGMAFLSSLKGRFPLEGQTSDPLAEGHRALS